MRQPPDRRQSGPQDTTPTSRQPSRSARPNDINTVTRRATRPRPVFVSLYEPVGRRRQWWYAYRCPACGTYQLGRARELDQVTGIRKAGCGHTVSIAIARVYRNSGAA